MDDARASDNPYASPREAGPASAEKSRTRPSVWRRYIWGHVALVIAPFASLMVTRPLFGPGVSEAVCVFFFLAGFLYIPIGIVTACVFSWRSESLNEWQILGLFVVEVGLVAVQCLTFMPLLH